MRDTSPYVVAEKNTTVRVCVVPVSASVLKYHQLPSVKFTESPYLASVVPGLHLRTLRIMNSINEKPSDAAAKVRFFPCGCLPGFISNNTKPSEVTAADITKPVDPAKPAESVVATKQPKRASKPAEKKKKKEKTSLWKTLEHTQDTITRENQLRRLLTSAPTDFADAHVLPEWWIRLVSNGNVLRRISVAQKDGLLIVGSRGLDGDTHDYAFFRAIADLMDAASVGEFVLDEGQFFAFFRFSDRSQRFQTRRHVCQRPSVC